MSGAWRSHVALLGGASASRQCLRPWVVSGCDGSRRAESPRHIIVSRANYAVVISRPKTNKMRSEESCFDEVMRLRPETQRSAATLPRVPEASESGDVVQATRANTSRQRGVREDLQELQKNWRWRRNEVNVTCGGSCSGVGSRGEVKSNFGSCQGRIRIGRAEEGLSFLLD